MHKSNKVCSVPQCITRCNKVDKIALHHFPNDKLLKKKWHHVIRIYKPVSKITQNDYVCSKHFGDSDYKNADNKRYLIKGAVPSKNLPQIKFSKPQPKPRNIRLQKLNVENINMESKLKSSAVEGTKNNHVAHNSTCPKKTVTSCFAPGCTSTSAATESNIQFHRFPWNSPLARLWTVKLRSDKTPTKSSRVCNKHFSPDDFIGSGTTGSQVLKRTAIPSRNIIKNSIEPLMILPTPTPDVQEERIPMHSTKNSIIDKKDATTQTDKQLVVRREAQTDFQSIPTETILYDELSADDFYFFTGLTLPNFKELTEYLEFDGKPNKYTVILSNYDQLVLTLINLRQRVEFKVVAKMYGIHIDVVREIFDFWINVIYDQFRITDLWALRESGDLGYTAIVDCCETACEMNNPAGVQSIPRPGKQKRPTIKYLVATDEQGMVIFCSTQLFDGSISNRHIIAKSGILAKLKNGDKILTECYFNSKHITIHHPDECSDVDKGRKYIKRLATMMKKFGILKGVLPAMLMPNAAKIVYVTNVLVNFVSEIED